MAVLAAIAMCALVVTAADDEVSFVEDDEPCDTYLVGQDNAALRVIWGQNITRWEVVLAHPLFNTVLHGATVGRLEAGHGYDMGLDFNESCPAGDYIVPVRMSYTTENGTDIVRDYGFTIHYIKSIELKRFAIERGRPNLIVVEVELFLPCDSLSIEFDTDGNLEGETEFIERGALEPGIYRFETELLRTGLFLSSDEEQVGYDVRANFGGETIQLVRKNIDPRTIARGSDPVAWVLMAIVFVAVLALALFLVRRARRGRSRLVPPVGPTDPLTGRS